MINTGGFGLTDQQKSSVIALWESLLESGQISYGPINRQVETSLSVLLFNGDRQVLTCASGTDALVAALLACKILRKDSHQTKVVVPALTFVASVNAVYHAGLEPVFCDTDEYNALSVDGLRQIMAERDDILAVMPVHLFGQTADMQTIRQICAKHDGRDKTVYIVEDCCEALGSQYVYGGEWVSAGSAGDFGAFSFYVAHHATSGVGGAVSAGDPAHAELIRSLLNHGRDLSYWKRNPDALPDPATVYRFKHVGLSSRMSEMQAALLLVQLDGDSFAKMISRRVEIVKYYNTMLARHEERGAVVLPTERDMSSSSWMFYPLLLNKRHIDRDTFARQLRDAGIETRPAMPLLNQPVYTNLFTPKEREMWDFKNAQEMASNGILLGCHHYMTDSEVWEVAKVTSKLLWDFVV